MGKWSDYRGLEGKYLVTSSARVVKLKRYLFQDFYMDSNDEKVYIEDLNNVFDNEKEAKVLSSKRKDFYTFHFIKNKAELYLLPTE